MNVMEAISARRAVRTYTHQAVGDVAIGSLLAAAVQAPSAMNAQPWSFVVIQDRGRLKRYSDRGKALLLASAPDRKTGRYDGMLRDQAFNIFYDAGTLLVICAKARDTYAQADCWLAAQNVMLAACEKGLSTCCIGFAVPVLNTEEVKSELRIPADLAAVAPIIVGYAKGVPVAPPRAEPRILSWMR